MSVLTIGQLAEKVKLKPSAIRYYEQKGLLPNPERMNGRRRYTEDVIPRIEFIKLTQNIGLTLEEILILIEGFNQNTSRAVQWRTLASKKMCEIEELIEDLNLMKLILQNAIDCECLSWDDCIENLSKARRNL
ncbi:MerR family transcriptional regulator [Caldalkalibacillus salinus]|uniref:MerR family transcriptional regulator n=1 Tax=Caldalkalibacillus salinus TaxID=2803787 RepID=UPI001924B7CA